MNLTLPTDSNERKEIPITSGVLRYFPAALAGVARVSKAGNDKHNPGEPLHHARGKSTDHADCIVRHLMDVQDLLAEHERAAVNARNAASILAEASQLCWRTLALSQELHERFGAPLAPGARLPDPAPSPYASKIIENACANAAHTPGFPITPGVYRSRDGRTRIVSRVYNGDDGDDGDDETKPYKAFNHNDNSCWTLGGRFLRSGAWHPADLVERVSDLP